MIVLRSNLLISGCLTALMFGIVFSFVATSWGWGWEGVGRGFPGLQREDITRLLASADLNDNWEGHRLLIQHGRPVAGALPLVAQALHDVNSRTRCFAIGSMGSAFSQESEYLDLVEETQAALEAEAAKIELVDIRQGWENWLDKNRRMYISRVRANSERERAAGPSP